MIELTTLAIIETSLLIISILPLPNTNVLPFKLFKFYRHAFMHTFSNSISKVFIKWSIVFYY